MVRCTSRATSASSPALSSAPNFAAPEHRRQFGVHAELVGLLLRPCRRVGGGVVAGVVFVTVVILEHVAQAYPSDTAVHSRNGMDRITVVP